MARENIMFLENNDESCTMTDLYLDINRFFGYKDSCSYYDIDVFFFFSSYNEQLLDIMM